MNICIIGSGGREATLAWKLSQSPKCTHLYTLPGNGGSNEFGSNVSLDINNTPLLVEFLLENDIKMLIVGPEAPLVDGIYDKLKKESLLSHLQIIGPSKTGAMLEGSKSFAKEFMQAYDIPTAAYGKFTVDELEEANAHLDNMKAPYVLKADGLAAGKGVLIIDDKEEAAWEIKNMLSGKFGAASETLVIEEFLDGIEFSVFALTDGTNYLLLPMAKDYKRRGEGDTGLNTGGMGAVSPVPFVDEKLMQKVIVRVIEPTIRGIHDRQIDYKGFVFFGLINVGGDPYVIEYNCRLGDPETEVIVPRIKSDLLELLESVYRGDLKDQKIEFDPHFATTIMLVSDGYPGSYKKGKVISGIKNVEGSLVFHAGTIKKDDAILSNGGRVLAISSLAETMNEALKKSMDNIEKITFEGKCFRSDIGFDL